MTLSVTDLRPLLGLGEILPSNTFTYISMLTCTGILCVCMKSRSDDPQTDSLLRRMVEKHSMEVYFCLLDVPPVVMQERVSNRSLRA